MFLAQCITPQAARWLAHTRRARFLNVSRSACNLINSRGEILSIVSPKIGAGPFSVVLEHEPVDFLEYDLTRSPIQSYPERIVLGSLTIEVGEAILWSPRPDWELLRLQRHRLFDSIAALGRWLEARAPSGGLTGLLPGLRKKAPGIPEDSDAVSLTDYLLLAMRKPVENLCAGIAYANLETCREAVRRLAGLGSGLTPAGDDFLLGASYAAWIFLPPLLARSILQTITDAASPQTTPLSAAFLMAASRGEASALWHTFLRDLLSSDLSAVRISADRILKVGHTSGADALAGFLAVSNRFAVHQITI